ncbi:putative nucleoprotein TPR/MLP1 [Helianthus annuus]|nr:putative nucleoprotein TPR/MLP1 [Helianthus annuus]
MPLFISDEEYARCSHDASLISQKADAYIKQLYNQLETEKAQHDASSITAEQTCSILEQKYVSLKSEFVTLQSQHAQLSSTLEERVSEVAQIQADKHQIYLQSIGKDGEIERLSLEVSELQKSKSQLLQLIEHKDLEISEKNSSIKGYLDKIVALTDTASSKESRISELEAEHARIHASLARLTQEKELVERHNLWLNDELTTKVNSSLELRKTHNELEADMSSKLADIERKYNDTCNTLKWKDDRIKELESKLEALQNELCSSKDTAAATEEQLSSELSTVNKLVELYKESADEWSKKAGELEGVIKALETHASQVEKDYKEKIEKETSARKQFENEVSQLKEKLAKCEADLENYRNSDQLNLLQMSSYNTKSYDVNNTNEDNNNLMLVPSIPAGISGTALAASLLRDGWSLVKMYEKYQEAIDAFRHEQLGSFVISKLKEECTAKTLHVEALESQLSAMKDDLEKEHQRWRTAQDNYERQVILQSDTIQELTKTSQELALIKETASELQRVFDILKAENDELKSKWETEKMLLEQSKDKAEKKFDEINEQNKILLDQLEALHIKLAEKSQGSGASAQSSDDGGLQNVVKYLRRSKEIAETEISLLKQEKLRLQSQLEGAMKAESEAQALLRAERENSRTVHFTEEEFKALQVQVREMNLLRESNVQLREENRHNFDECQKLRQSNHNANIEVENLNGLLVQRQNEVEACKREIETYKKNQKDLETRIGELVDKFKDMDPEEYVRMRAEFQQMNVKLSDKDGQLEEIKKLVSEKQLVIVRLEQDLARSKVEIDERELKINTVVQTESSLKSEVDKQKRLIYQLKRRCENLAKEKEETLKKNQELSKELVDSNQVKRSNVDSSGEEKDARIQMLEKTVEKLRDESREKEEKDTRIQMLEKTVDRLRDEVKKGKDEIRSEKSKNQKTEKGIGEERLKLTDDLEKHKHALKTLVDEVEKLKNEGDWFDDVAAACHAAVENFEQMAAHHVSGEFGTVTATDTPPIESTVPVPSRTATSEVVTTTTTTAMIPAEESATAKAPAVSKPKVEPRKVARRLVRPRIAKPEQPKRDMDMSEAADANVLSSVRKRPSTSEGPGSHVRDPSVADVAPPQVKKSKASEPPHDGGEVPETVTEESPVGDELQNTKEDEEVETVGDEQAVEDDGEENVNKTETEEQRNVTEVEHIQSQTVTGEGGSEPEEGEMETDQARSPSPMPAEEDIIEETETLGDLEVSSPLLTTEDNEDKTEEGEIEVEETTPESSTDKQLTNDGNDEAGSTAEEAAIDHVPATTAVPVPEKPSKTSAMAEPSGSVGNQDSSVSSVVPTSAGPTQEEPVVDTGSTTINLNERARQRSLQRMAGAQPLPPVARGRGRVVRGRTRGGRTGRGGQTPGSQGM